MSMEVDKLLDDRLRKTIGSVLTFFSGGVIVEASVGDAVENLGP